ncbi:hypothetical protein DFH07DRAFT_781476 [Mycena maculata]|uniref:Uncharacterized protein n=1 Tax=Mycena maculata TaxID=230809 RepID=A0AAD7HZ00_9AGAR|nr:hypothetical protein DFH07DRAFT_781476 [Mycena maculata]
MHSHRSNQCRPIRTHPYRRQTPLLPTREHGWLTEAYDLYRQLNRVEGKLCSWDHGITDTWFEVPRPQRSTSRGAVNLAASGFERVWPKHSSPFFCPHTRNNGEPYNPLVLRLGGLFEGGIADYFKATDHQCAFKVVVPPLRQTNYLVTWEDRQRYQGTLLDFFFYFSLTLSTEEQDSHQQDEEEKEPEPSSSQSSSSSISSTSSKSSTDSIISHLAVEASLTPDPRYGRLGTGQIGRPQPRPVGVGTVLDGPRPPKSYFPLATATARKRADINTMEYMLQIDASGMLAEDPTIHPAWNMEEPHKILRVYDERIYPNCLKRTFNHCRFLYKPTGQVVKELNSTLGVPYCDYASMIRTTQIFLQMGITFISRTDVAQTIQIFAKSSNAICQRLGSGFVPSETANDLNFKKLYVPLSRLRSWSGIHVSEFPQTCGWWYLQLLLLVSGATWLGPSQPIICI